MASSTPIGATIPSCAMGPSSAADEGHQATGGGQAGHHDGQARVPQREDDRLFPVAAGG